MNIPQALYTCAQVKELDRTAIEDHGIAGFELMAKAGQAAFNIIKNRWPNQRQLTVLCGGGNNGGDGYVVAGLALRHGYSVLVYAMVPPTQLTGDALKAYDFFCDEPGDTHLVLVDDSTEVVMQGVIVDALLGIGIKGEVRSDYQALIQAANESESPIISIDIPSGLCGDTGTVLGNAIIADATITYIGTKRGLLTHQAKQYVGKLFYDSLGVGKAVLQSQTPSARRLQYSVPLLSPRQPDSHKGSFGRLLVVAGNENMGGAAIMSAEAGLQAGAGLVYLATAASNMPAVITRRPELMVCDFENNPEFTELLEQATGVVIGPGLGMSDHASSLLKRVVECDAPMVVDADGLNLLADHDGTSLTWVLTPHPGEAARLLGCSTTDVQNDRFSAVQALQAKYQGVVVLKGAGTLIADGERIYLCDKGNPAMSSPGMGDVLAGTIGGLMAQGLSSIDAATKGVWAHALAGDQAAAELGRHLMATELYPFLREIW